MIANILIILGVACMAVGFGFLALRLVHGRPDVHRGVPPGGDLPG